MAGDIDTEIYKLDEIILKMAGQVQANLRYAMNAYLHFDPEFDYQPVEDNKVNAYEREVEEMCLSLMLKERLFAADMRKVSGIMTMVQDLERLGDHAQDVLQFSLCLENKQTDNPKIKTLTEYVMKMVDDAISSYIIRSEKGAQKVIDEDDYVDKTYLDIIQSLIEKDQKKEVSSSFAIYTTLVVKYIERIADHATNIAEWVIYILTGYYKDTQII